MYSSRNLNQNARHLNGSGKRAIAHVSGVRVRPRSGGCPPGPGEGGLERRSGARLTRLFATALTLLAVGTFAAIVGEALGRLLVGPPLDIAPRKEIRP